MHKTIQYSIIFVTLVVLASTVMGDAFDQTVAQIQTLEAELAQNLTPIEENQTLIDQQLSTLRENHDLNAPKGQFESDEEYIARLRQLDTEISQRRTELEEQHLSGLLARNIEIQPQIARLYRRIFRTHDISTTLGEYNANAEFFPITFEATLNGTIQYFNAHLSINKVDARDLFDNWEEVIVTGWLSIDLGYRRGLAQVKLEYLPLWEQGVTWTFDVVYNLGNNNSVAFSPYGKYIATGSNDEQGIATIWKMENGERFRKMDHGDQVYAVAFSPDGKYFATAGEDETRYSDNGKAIVWDMSKGTKVQTIEHSQYVRTVAFSTDSKYLATARLRYSDKGSLFLWRVQGEAVWGIDYRANSSTIQALAFSPSSTYLATGNVRQYSDYLDRATLWQVSNGEAAGNFEHKNGVYAVAFSPNGKYLATGNNGSVTLWDNRGRIVRQIDLPNTIVYAIAFSPDGEFFAVGKSDGFINFFQIGAEDITLETEITRVKSISTGSEVRDLAWHPSGILISDGKKVYRILLQPIFTDLVVKPLSTQRDVNRDGVVDVDDLVLVASNFGKFFAADANPNPDVNRDGVVDRTDIIEIIISLESAPRAPSAYSQTIPTLAAAKLQRWIDYAKQRDNQDETFQRGIRVLEQLLATLKQTETVPEETVLLPNYPNPFNPETWIPYHLAADADVQLTIYDTKGELVRQFELGYRLAGYYTDPHRAVYWDGRSETGERVASGIYFYHLRVKNPQSDSGAGNFSAMRKMVIQK